MNPLYEAYARAHGKTPDDMLEFDKEQYPGGCMCGFTLWIRKKKAEFYHAHPEAFFDRFSIVDMAAWYNFVCGIKDEDDD